MGNDIHLSVRTLVEYVYRSGSIDSRFHSPSTLVEGTRIHQKIQKTYQETDEKEVYLRTEIPYHSLTFVIEGRCDGLLFREDEVIVDEIKSFSQTFDEQGEGYPVHWAQAKMYAYIYSKDHEFSDMTVQLTYVHVESDEKIYYQKTFSFPELERFAFEMIEGYAPFAIQKQEHLIQRNDRIKELPFPFESYRAGQRKLAGVVYKSILDEKSLFTQAPTGIGKTISTLFPSVKAIGEGHSNRIFYLTAKTITRTTAEEAFTKMRQSGLCFKTITITAKDKVCFKDETICQKEVCEYANGYYDRINEAILDILKNEQGITREVVETYARKHRICPFEFSIDLAYEVDAVICDYNYIFDPRVSLKRLIEEQKKSTVLLVDEAHNLVDRGRDMFSATLHKRTFLQLKKDYKGTNESIYVSAHRINAWFIALKKEKEQHEFVLDELDDHLKQLLLSFMEVTELALKTDPSAQLLDAYYEVKNFLKITDLLDDSYLIYGEKERNDIHIKLFCINPAEPLKKMGKGYRSKIFFSATLSPLPYYQDILGGQEVDYVLSLPSPFSSEQTEVFIEPLSTRYRDRDHTKAKIVSIITSLLRHRPGHYLIFFPSYQYLLTVYDLFKQENPEIQTLIQQTGMTEEEREAFLAAFQPNSKDTLLGFAVLGGIFSEGIDLIGDRLNGVIVVGVGLPQIGFERNLIKDYFNKQGKNGYHYAYVFPGMNKVLQAGGRLIRSEKDHGTIVLIDDRFLQQPYRQLLPETWKK
ncbi:ATP-dependent DNA helicase [Niallia sp. Krafla_26]|uniref:ATP-dependent DNA helicase n=1 Tax=Niallia sp. Krafla_26 TaxID=3064703 RepID=UPI003D17A8F0